MHDGMAKPSERANSNIGVLNLMSAALMAIEFWPQKELSTQ